MAQLLLGCVVKMRVLFTSFMGTHFTIFYTTKIKDRFP